MVRSFSLVHLLITTIYNKKPLADNITDAYRGRLQKLPGSEVGAMKAKVEAPCRYFIR